MTLEKPIQLSPNDLVVWMGCLIKRARDAGNLGEIPVAAVVLDSKGRCIGHGTNSRERDINPLGHAELTALRQASLIKNDWRFNECTLIVTLEPCPMCAGALVQARMGQVIFGAFDIKRGAFGSTLDLANHQSAHHQMEVKGGILEKEANQLIQSWFKKLRQNCS